MSKKEEKPEVTEEAPKPKGKKKLFIIIGFVLLLLGAGVPAYLFLGKGKAKDKAEEHVEEPKHYLVAKLDTLVVNLAQSGNFLKVSLLLEYDPEALVVKGEHGAVHAASGGHGAAKEEGLPGKLGEREPMIKDAVIRVLSSKKGEEVLSSEGKETLKEELIDSLNEAVGTEEPAIVQVYFTEFLVQ